MSKDTDRTPEDDLVYEHLVELVKLIERTGQKVTGAEAAGGGFKSGQADVTRCALKKVIKPAHKRRQLSALQDAYRVSTRRACEVIQLQRSTYYYQSTRPTDAALRHRLRELTAVRVRYGYLRLHVLLRREGWQVTHKKVYRIYCEEGLNLRSKRPRRRRNFILTLSA